MKSNTSYLIQVSGAEELIRHGLHGFFESKLIPPLGKGRPGGVDFLCLIINHPQPLFSKEGGDITA